MNRDHTILYRVVPVLLLVTTAFSAPDELSDQEFAVRIKKEVFWAEFPYANRVVDRVPDRFSSARAMRARVEDSISGRGDLTLGLRVGLSADGSWGNVHFNGPLVTFRIRRSLPIPRDEIVGDEISVYFDASGDLISINLLGIGVTHARSLPDQGKLEVQALIENDDFLVLFNPSASEAERGRALERAPSFAFVPDKVALHDQDTTQLFYFRLLQLVKGYGVVVQTMDTGPGAIELESIDLAPPTEAIPWIPIGEWSRWGPVPPKQRTRN